MITVLPSAGWNMSRLVTGSLTTTILAFEIHVYITAFSIICRHNIRTYYANSHPDIYHSLDPERGSSLQ